MGASTDPGVTVLVARLAKSGEDAQDLEMRPMEGSAALPTPALDLQYVVCGLGKTPKDFPKEVKGRIALVQRGEITFREKALAAEKAGAVACVIYNNRDGGFFGSIGEDAPVPQIPVIAISKADGELMLKAFEKGSVISNASLQLSPEEVPQPDRLAEFSSRGPNNDQYIKPELTAPGVNILSATILQAALPGGGMPDASGYISASGTSMATPHVAGASALMRQAHPDWNSMQIKAALVNTARWMARQGGVMDQGNGAIDLVKAVDAKAILVTATDPISPTFSFGRVAHEGKERSISQPLVILPLQKDPDKTNYKLSVEIAGQPDGMKAELAAGATICSGEPQAAFNLALDIDGTKLPDGPYYGHVVAEADWGTLRLPFYVEAVKFLSDQPSEPQQPGKQESHPPVRRRVGEMPLT